MTKDGEVYTWGKAKDGRLGVGAIWDGEVITEHEKIDNPLEESRLSSLPLQVGLKKKALGVTAGFAYSAAVCDDGTVAVWGRGWNENVKKVNYGDLVVREDQSVPRFFSLPENRKAIEIHGRYAY